jgi:hypothetical protein
MGRAANVALEQGAARAEGASTRQYQELWFALAQRPWTTIVLVPADPDGSAAAIGRSLAEVGKHLSEVPVTAISLSSIEYGSALALADLQQHIARNGRGATVEREPLIEVTATVVPKGEQAETTSTTAPPEALAIAPAARLIISIPAVVSEPLGLAAAHGADATVVCIEVGRTHLANARRTVELIGRERIAGCFLVR